MMMRVPFSTAGFMAQPRPRQRWIAAGTVLWVLLIAAGLSAWHYRPRIELHFGQAALDELEFHDADQWAQAVISRNPEDIDGLLLARTKVCLGRELRRKPMVWCCRLLRAASGLCHHPQLCNLRDLFAQRGFLLRWVLSGAKYFLQQQQPLPRGPAL